MQNAIANRILYPQTIPVTLEEMQIDLSIMREALKKNKSFISKSDRKIFIPDSFLYRIPDLAKLVWVFIDAYILDQEISENAPVWTVVLRGGKDEIVGSVILPKMLSGDIMEVTLEGKKIVAKKGGLTLIPCTENKCKMQFKLKLGSVLGKREGIVEVSGGRLGLLIDGREL